MFWLKSLVLIDLFVPLVSGSEMALLTIQPESVYLGDSVQITCIHGHLYRGKCPNPREIQINKSDFYLYELLRLNYSYASSQDHEDTQYPCRFTLTHHNVTAEENGTTYSCIYSVIDGTNFESNNGTLRVIASRRPLKIQSVWTTLEFRTTPTDHEVSITTTATHSTHTTEPITQSADTDRDNLVIIISGISGGVVVLLLMALCLVVVILVAVLIRAKPHKMETKDCNKDPIYENPNDMVGQPGPETQIPLTVNPGYESIVLSCGRHLYENRGQAHGDVQAMQNEDN